MIRWKIATFALAISLAGGAWADERRPNVVLIITDDQGYGDFGVHGNPVLRTPRLDRLAAESVRLGQFQVSPVCAPTRASLLTGRYAYRTGVVDTYLGRALMHADEVTLAEVLAASGYRTGIFGKWHLGDDYPLRPQDQGFQETLVHRGGGIGQPAGPPDNHYADPWLQENGRSVQKHGYCSDVFTDAAMEFIERHRDEPFFAYLAFNAPHTPLEVPDEVLRRYWPSSTDPHLNEETARVYAMISNIDDNVGRLLDRLETLGLREDTILVFLTDNGPQQARFNGPLRDLKGSVYQGGIQVPCFVRWPRRFSAGRVVDAPAAHIDLLPTLAAACGAPLPERELDGVNLLPLLTADAAELAPRCLFTQYHRGDVPERYRSCAVRRSNWKLVQPLGQRHDALPSSWRYELYDLARDPGESRDVSAEHPQIVAELSAEYERWFDEMQSERGFLPPRIVLGHDAENPVTLTRQDWRGPQADWTGRGVGHWEVDVARAGTYDVELRFAVLTRAATVRFRLGPATFESSVAAGANTCSWHGISLSAGAARLSGEIEEAGAVTGPEYVSVRRVE